MEKKAEVPLVQPPARTWSTEFFVGLFMLFGLGTLGYQAVGLGGFEPFSSRYYELFAEFDNVAGLKTGAPVELAGVGVGEVVDIILKDPEAIVVLKMVNEFQVREDDIASIRTKGIIGDRYIKLSRGISDVYLAPSETIIETESVVDIEDLIGKLVHNFTGEEDEKSEELDI